MLVAAGGHRPEWEQNGRMAQTLVLPGGAGLGTAPMGGPGWQLDWGPSDPDEPVAAVRAAVAAGADWIDTAPFYGWGRAEQIVGAALEGMTGRPVVLTKCGDVRGPDGRAYDDHRRAPEADGVLDWCTEHGVPFLAWSPLASGFLADGFDLAALTAGDLRRRLRWADAPVVDFAGLRRDLGAIASGAGLSMSVLAAGWVLARGAQPIIGARTATEAGQIATFRPISPELAASAQAAADAAFTAAR
jgi:aryl-alcohol dehydrogenase-like predicted oxidoreductase